MILLFTCVVAGAFAQQRITTVPFVGCESEGQVGPQPVPKAPPKSAALDPRLAARLAWYSAFDADSGVLAPRGWHCFGTYGSAGDAIFVSPAAIGKDQFFGSNSKPIPGPLVQFSRRVGDTSGRFAVAQVMAIAFPDWRDRVESIMKEFGQTPSEYHFGPYPSDKLIYKSQSTV